MIQILIAILQLLGVVATPDQLNNDTFKQQNQIEISKATEIYNTNHYTLRDGVVVVDDISTRN